MKDSRRRVLGLAALFAGLLVMLFVLQLPTWRVADFGQFAFYDPGTTLKGDLLLSKGMLPTVDFGYTHGLLSLVFGRAGFFVLGRRPAGFLVLTLLTELVMAHALARILRAAGISRKGVLILVAALPMAIMPAYLTLTHPLEAMVILLALAAQAEGKRPRALALCAACVFVKPSMGYVYGFLLVVIMVWNTLRHTRVSLGERVGSIVRQLAPAAVTGCVLFVGLWLYFGVGPVLQTLLPTTGAKTYAATGFGFFTQAGRGFWMPGSVKDFFITPAFVFLVAAGASAAGAVWSGYQLIRRPTISAVHVQSRQRAWELLLTVGFLHSAFLVGFYGWPGSWSYYSYLPSLGLMLAVVLLPIRRQVRTGVAVAVIAVLLVSHGSLAGTVYAAWHDKARVAGQPPAGMGTGGLWCYPEQFSEFEAAVAAAGDGPTLLMTNGMPPNLPGTVSLPEAWFPELGIPTWSELERVKKQVEGTRCVILWKPYQQFEDVWYAEPIRPLHGEFRVIFDGAWFTVLERSGARGAGLGENRNR